jgi:Domain of unknown function (DUF3303)
MLYMVIEHYKDGKGAEVYQRFVERGRMAPEGLRYVDSWVDLSFRRCFQVMECDDPTLLSQWIANWQDIVEFEVVPVLTSAAAGIMAPKSQEEG